MLALTLWPEWAWAICHLDKRVENRGWRPPERMIGERFAIHAGAHVGGRPLTRGTAGYNRALRAIDAVARLADLAGWVVEDQQHAWDFRRHGEPREAARSLCFQGRAQLVRSALVCTVRLAGVDREQRTAWDIEGAWHWRLDEVRPVAPPIPWPRGQLGLWPVVVSLEEVLR